MAHYRTTLVFSKLNQMWKTDSRLLHESRCEFTPYFSREIIVKNITLAQSFAWKAWIGAISHPNSCSFVNVERPVALTSHTCFVLTNWQPVLFAVKRLRRVVCSFGAFFLPSPTAYVRIPLAPYVVAGRVQPSLTSFTLDDQLALRVRLRAYAAHHERRARAAFWNYTKI